VTLGVLVAGVLVTAALALTGLLAHRHLRDAQVAVGQLRSSLGDPDTTTAEIDRRVADVQDHARAARALTGTVLWSAPARLPWVGRPLETASGVAAAVATVAEDVVPPVVDVRNRLVGVDLTRKGGGIDLAPLAASEQPLGSASAAADAALARLEALPRTAIGPIDTGRADAQRQLQELSTTLGTAHEAVAVLPPMLGADGPRNYFVAFQNPAEARGAGGLPGVYAVVRAHRGSLSFVHYGVSGDFAGVRVSLDGLSPGFAGHYQGAAPDRYFGNSTVSPHFPDGATLMLRYWKARTGQQLDGALSVDPQALAFMLEVTGPTTMPDRTVLSASSVVRIVERDAYERFTDPVVRKQYLIKIAKAVADDLLTKGPAKATALAEAVGRAVGERRVLLFSTREEEQRVLAAHRVGGTLSDTDGLFSGVVINNGGGNKLDYYLRREVTYEGAPCGAPDPRATVTIRLTNTAPRSGLTSYVSGRADVPVEPVKPGTNRLLVGYYATKDAGFSDVTVDGKPGFLAVDEERGRPVFTAELEIAPGQTRTVVLRVEEPPQARGPMTTLVQPLVLPQRTRVSVPTCGTSSAR
jgi:hypothetical protein